MRRTAIKPKRLYQLAVEFMASRPARTSHGEGGRPRIYDDALILTIASIQNLHQFSYREALEFCEDYFTELPTLSTYHYRLETFSPDIPQGFIEHLGKKIVQGAPEKGRFFIMDGTGFSFRDVYPMKFHLGTDIRKIRAHVKVAALVAATGKRKFVVVASAGPPYASEIKLIEPLLDRMDIPTDVLGDKGYDCIRLIQKILDRGCAPVIDIKESRFHQIRSLLRLLSKENADDHDRYKRRTLIEGLFGNVKQKLSSHIRVFDQKIAGIFSLLRLAILNMAVLEKLERQMALSWLWFSNSAGTDLTNI